jgi:protein-tyrosine phosphatase
MTTESTERKIRILFVCLGNICRSPMAESIFSKIIESKNQLNDFEIDSAGLINYHQGELADSRMRSHGLKRGYTIRSRSRQITKQDLDYYDWILAMDNQNMEGLHRIATTPNQYGKFHLITDFCEHNEANHVPDPYYGGEQGFENVIDILEDACMGLFKSINNAFQYPL